MPTLPKSLKEFVAEHPGSEQIVNMVNRATLASKNAEERLALVEQIVGFAAELAELRVDVKVKDGEIPSAFAGLTRSQVMGPRASIGRDARQILQEREQTQRFNNKQRVPNMIEGMQRELVESGIADRVADRVMDEVVKLSNTPAYAQTGPHNEEKIGDDEKLQLGRPPAEDICQPPARVKDATHRKSVPMVHPERTPGRGGTAGDC